MQSRRDCKPDLRFDQLLKLLYDNISSYEAQVCAGTWKPCLGIKVSCRKLDLYHIREWRCDRWGSKPVKMLVAVDSCMA